MCETKGTEHGVGLLARGTIARRVCAMEVDVVAIVVAKDTPADFLGGLT